MSNVSYHVLKYPACRARTDFVHSIVRATYPTFFDLHFGAAFMSHFRRTYVPGGSIFFIVVTE